MSSIIQNPSQKTKYLTDTLAVFQNEVGIIPSEKFTKIITPTPSHCTLVCLYHSERQVSVLGHIDEYTSVSSTINKIEELLKRKFVLSLNGPKFTATIMGGSNRIASIEQNQELKTLLSERGVDIRQKKLQGEGSQRPQILLDSSGNIHELKGKNKNLALEAEQRFEYGSFNDQLDKDYDGIPGSDIPYFQAKEATRNALECPLLSSSTIIQPVNPEKLKSAKYSKAEPEFIQKARLLANSEYLPIAKRLSPYRIEARTTPLLGSNNEMLVGTLVSLTALFWACIFLRRRLNR